MENSPDLRKDEMSLERPLSPVLSTGKKSTFLKSGGRLRKKTSKANLSKRFTENEAAQRNTTRETVCLYFSDLPDPSDSPEVRLKKLQRMEERRKEYLKYLTEIHPEGEQAFTSKEIKSDDIRFKKPLSPVVHKTRKESFFSGTVTCDDVLQETGKDSITANLKETEAEQENCDHFQTNVKKFIEDSCKSNSVVSEYKTLLSNSQFKEFQSVTSRENDAESSNAQEKSSYFKYVSHFLDKLEKQKTLQQLEIPNISQAQAVSDIHFHCQNMLNVINLVDKSSVSPSATDKSYGYPAFHGFEENCIKLAKERVARCGNLIARYEKFNKGTLEDNTEEAVCCHQMEVKEPKLLSENNTSNNELITLYHYNKKHCSYKKPAPIGDFDRQMQTQEWFDSCFAEADFKKRMKTDTNESTSVNVSEMGDTNKTLKTDEPVCHSPGFGFKCASGKLISIPQAALLKAAKVFDEVLLKSDDKMQQKSNDIETIHLNMEFSNNSLKDETASSTTINTENNNSASTLENENTYTLQVQSAPTVQFLSASGKGIAISKSALAQAKAIFNGVENEVKTENIETSIAGFKTAAGSKINVSAKAIDTAQKIFEDTNQNHNHSTVCKTPTNEKNVLSNKKHLGIPHHMKQITVQPNNLERARKMFEDISSDFQTEYQPNSPSVKAAFSFNTPKKQHYVTPSTPLPMCNSSPIFYNKLNYDDKTVVNKTAKDTVWNKSNSHVVIADATVGNVNEWLEDLNEEERKLQQQLQLVSLKKETLQQQQLQSATETLKRYYNFCN